MGKEDTIEIAGMTITASRILDVRIKRRMSVWSVVGKTLLPAGLAVCLLLTTKTWAVALCTLALLSTTFDLIKTFKKWLRSPWKVQMRVRYNDWSDGFWITHSGPRPLEKARETKKKIEEKLTIHALKTGSLNV